MKTGILAILTILTFSFFAPEDSVVVIVNKSNTIESLSLTEIRIYWMRRPKKRWEGIDKAVRPVDRKNGCAEKDRFFKEIIKMTADQVDSYFSARQYQTGENPPDKFLTDQEIINFVGAEPGAIGYVNKASINDEVLKKVKVVFTLE